MPSRDELVRHTQASHEATLEQISACLEPFAGLPEHVSWLETAVFPSKHGVHDGSYLSLKMTK
jgi:hypothetical protein